MAISFNGSQNPVDIVYKDSIDYKLVNEVIYNGDSVWQAPARSIPMEYSLYYWWYPNSNSVTSSTKYLYSTDIRLNDGTWLRGNEPHHDYLGTVNVTGGDTLRFQARCFGSSATTPAYPKRAIVYLNGYVMADVRNDNVGSTESATANYDYTVRNNLDHITVDYSNYTTTYGGQTYYTSVMYIHTYL